MGKGFEGIIGNDQIKQYLTQVVRKDAIGNSLLFSGIDGVGKSLFAEEFAKLILNSDTLQHPDIHIYRPEGKLGMHSIDSMRQMCEKVYLAPFSGNRKVFIIHHAEKMLPSSANSLLKTFEEPSLDTIMILISSNPAALLPTVLSRCRVIRFHHLTQDEIKDFLIQKYEKNEPEATQIAALSAGSIGKAVQLLSSESDMIRKAMMELLSNGKLKFYGDLINASKEIFNLVEEVKKQEEATIKSLLTKGYEDLTAAQMHHLTKEVEGAVSMKQSSFTSAIFELVLSWYRDLHLLQCNADERLLINPDYIEPLKESLKTKKLLSLESIQKMISEAKLLLERSTSLNIVLENLFLKLGIL